VVPGDAASLSLVNGNCAANGIDITYFVSYLKGQQPALLHCANCPPAGAIARNGGFTPIKVEE